METVHRDVLRKMRVQVFGRKNSIATEVLANLYFLNLDVFSIATSLLATKDESLLTHCESRMKQKRTAFDVWISIRKGDAPYLDRLI